MKLNDIVKSNITLTPLKFGDVGEIVEVNKKRPYPFMVEFAHIGHHVPMREHELEILVKS